MEREQESVVKLSRLRLVLPDLSQSLIGNWLASVEKSIPPDLRHNYGDFFSASDVASGDNVATTKPNRGDERGGIESPALKRTQSNEDKRHSSIAENSTSLWLRVGEMPPCDPVLRTWELCHELEKLPRKKIAQEIAEKSPSHRSLFTEEKSLQAEPSDQGTCLPESKLVRDALNALQGVHAAVRNLENLSKIYSASPADRCTQKTFTLWTRSVTASALGKILSVIARAGQVRCHLDAFVSFFLDDPLNPFGSESDALSQLSRRARRRQKKRLQSGAREFSEYAKNTRKLAEDIPRHCLVNQAFAGAVKGILRGHTAALNTLAASVALRRGHESKHGSKPPNLRDHDPGPVVGYDGLDISLLEFYLHTRELRVQLHALAFVCLMRDGKPFVGRNINDSDTEDDVATRLARNRRLPLGKKTEAINDQSKKLMRSFESFPRGADLLTYLYDQLMDMDPLHMELFRFLFERTYEPYSVFIQSWLYQASVRDPYGEFIIEDAEFCDTSATPVEKRDTLKVPVSLNLRSGVHVPRFLERICIPLIRAGEQLRVLLRLPETCQLTQQMATNMRNWESLLPQKPSPQLGRSGGSTTVLPALVFSKKKLDDIADKRAKKSQELWEQFDVLFDILSSRRSRGKSSGVGFVNVESTRLSPHLQVRDVDRSGCLVADVAVYHQGCHGQPSTREYPDLVGANPRSSTYKVTLPPRGWMSSQEHQVVGDEKLPGAKDRSQGAVKSSSRKVRESETNKADLGKVADEAWIHLGPFGSGRLVASGEVMSEGHSFLSDHQRGTSWPLWGLPLNPFLVQTEGDDSAPNMYVHPSFEGTYRHWDVAAKPVTKSTSSNVDTSLNKAGVEPTGRWTEKSFEPQWFANLELTLDKQLFAGLDTQLNFPAWGQADVALGNLDEYNEKDLLGDFGQSSLGWDEMVNSPDRFSDLPLLSAGLQESQASSRHFEGLGVGFPDVVSTNVVDLQVRQDQMKPSIHTRPESIEDETVPLWLQLPGHVRCETREEPIEDMDDAFFSSPSNSTWNDSEKNAESLERIVQDVKLQPSERTVDGMTNGFELKECDTRELRLDPTPSDDILAHGPAAWEHYLTSSDPTGPGAATSANGIDLAEDKDYEDEEIPLSVVVSKCVADEILSQYQSISALTVRLFQEGLGLQDHYIALRRYFFMERGDWAEYFIAALCQHKWGTWSGENRQMEVQELLEAALQKSSCDGDEYAERVYACWEEENHPSEKLALSFKLTSPSPFIDCSRLDAFDFVYLQYRVDWPLNLILTGPSFRLYNTVFAFLMRVKLTVRALDDIWQRLQVIDRTLHKERGSTMFLQQKNRFRTLQQFRQQICHFIMALQRHVESKLLNVVWSKFLQDIQEVNDLQDLEIVHRRYLEGAIEECFLSGKTASVKDCIDSVMQSVLDFSSHMKGSLYRSGDKSQVIDDGLFMQVHQIKKGFQTSLLLLHGYHTKQDPQIRSNLADLWTILDYNNFLTRALSTERL